MNDTAEQDHLLTSAEAADFLQVHPKTLKRWRMEGTVPFIRYPSGRVRFNRAELVVWLDQRARGKR